MQHFHDDVMLLIPPTDFFPYIIENVAGNFSIKTGFLL